MKKALFATLGVAAFMAAHSAQAQTTLKVIGFLSPKSMSASRCIDPWLAVLGPNVGKDVKFQTYHGGSLGRNPRQQYQLIENGVGDMGYTLPGYRPGQFPDNSVFELPYLAQSSAEAAVAQWRMYNMGLLGGFENTKVLSFISIDPYVLHLKKPIEKLDDLRGVKIRTAGPVFSDFVKSVGGVPVAMPVTQMVESLQRGIVEGAVLGWSGSRVFRIDRVTKFHWEGPFGVAPVALVMNKKTWAALPRLAKDAFNQFGGEFVSKLCGRAFDLDVASGIALAEKAGHGIRRAQPGDIEKGRARFKNVHTAWINRTKDGQKKYDAAVKLLAEVRAEMAAGK